MPKLTILAIVCLTTLLALVACNSAASPAPATPGPARTGTTVIPVNQEIEHEGITVGVVDVTLSGQETLVRYWFDCDTLQESMPTNGSRLVLGGGLAMRVTGGGGGSGCGRSDIRQLEFDPIPPDVKTLSFQHGPFWGSDTEELVLEIPIEGKISEMKSVIGGELDLDIVAESEGLAYRFLSLSARIAQFTLTYEPANEERRWRPLTGPFSKLTMEDDRGNKLVGNGREIRWDSENGYAYKHELIDFKGALDRTASLWTLRVSRPGKLFRGPWNFDIEIPSGQASARDLPTATPGPTATAIPKPTLAPRSTPVPGLEPSWLQQAFAMTPLEFADKPVLFADYDRSRVVADLEEFRGPEFPPQNITSEKLTRFFGSLYEGVPLPEPLGGYTDTLNKLVGLNLIGMDSGVWSLEGPLFSPRFLLMRGVFDEATIAGNLLELDYKPDDYRGTPYYWLNEDPKSDMSHPLRQMGFTLNRVALMDEWFVASPSADVIEKLIVLQQDNDANLLDSAPHRLLAETIGADLLGAVFTTPERIVKDWNARTQPSDALLERYLDGPDSWEPLSPHKVAMLGYRVRDDSEEIVMALYYPDADSADTDTGKLEKRWSSFHFGSGEAEQPVTNSCSPLSTTVVQFESSSILVGVCLVIRRTQSDSTMLAPHLWKFLYLQREIQFLAQDLNKLETAGRQK
jgi:hypothetical protein